VLLTQLMSFAARVEQQIVLPFLYGRAVYALHSGQVPYTV
jgi:hypothetical protein